jgi:hypothetical protein
MEYNINGILYFDKESTTPINTKSNNNLYELEEYKILKNWLIFKQKPKSLEEIKILELKVDLFIKKKIKNFEYNFSNNSNFNIDASNIENNVPECYYRYKSLLSNIIEL